MTEREKAAIAARQAARESARKNSSRSRRFITPEEEVAVRATTGFIPRADYRQAPALMYVGEIGILNGEIICVVQA